MSKFIGRRFISGGGGDGYNDHGQLTGLLDDDHPQYLITTAIRTLGAPTSGLTKTDLSAGDVFSLTNAGSGAALFIKQTGTTTDADAAVDIDNSGNEGRGLSVISDTADPNLPLVQFSALTSTFDEPVLLLTHADPCGLGLEVRGDAYISCQLELGEGLILNSQNSNPFALGEAGIYVKGDEFFYVFPDGTERTWTTATGGGGTVVNLVEGCNINLDEIDGYTEISVDIQSLAGEGLIVTQNPDGYCSSLSVDIDAYQVGFDDSNTIIIKGDDLQEVIEVIDGYLQGAGKVTTIHKFGSEAEDPDFRSIFSTDGYEFPIDANRLLVTLNGILQFNPLHYTESSTTTITFIDPVDVDDEIVICIFPGSLGNASAGTTNLQSAYNNSPSGAKSIILDDGQINLVQTLATGSVLRLTSNTSVTTALDIIQSGSGEAGRLKSISESAPTILLQKDAASRNTVLESIVVERTTSHISGGLTGIGSAFVTKLEDTGNNLFTASRIVTGTEDAADAAEKTYLSVELMDDGVLAEHLRLNSIGQLSLGTTTPNSTLHVVGDGYFTDGLEVIEKVIAGSGSTNASLNVKIFGSDPPILNNGDMWVTDSGGTRQINVRIGGVTYSVTLT